MKKEHFERTIEINGRPIKLSKRVIVPKEDSKGYFKTLDGVLYKRDLKTGQIRKVV